VSKTYAIADLHGRHDLLIGALHAIRTKDKESGQHGGTIVTLGDYIDRGPKSAQIIETLMSGLDPVFGPGHGFTLVCLRGNHEDIMLASHDAIGLTCRWWIPNGGGETLRSYGALETDTIADAWGRVPQSHIDWIRSLPRIHSDEHRVFVHAGVIDGIPLDQQSDEKTAWMLYPEGADGGHEGRHVVHGHHQFSDGPKVFSQRTDLDTFAWFTGRLVVGVFDGARPGGAVDFIEVFDRPYDEMWQVAA
jgi:serine/threonine protein phosphatase 1